MTTNVVLAGLCLTLSVITCAAEESTRPDGRVLFPDPALAKPGTCVVYREGGAGWMLTEPVYWLRGTTIAGEVKQRHVGRCPMVPGKRIEEYSREEFNRLAAAHPCVEREENVRDEDFGAIRLRVEDWDTPWARRAANAGRLYQGSYLDQPLQNGIELELDARLLNACR